MAVRLVVEAAAGRVPVWAGCTHNSTRTLVRQAALLRQIRGVDAVLSANPYYNKPSQEGQFQHFLALAKAVDPLPVTLYNVPGRTGRRISNRRPSCGWPRPRPTSRPSRKPAASCRRSPSWCTSLPHGFKVFSGDDNLALASIGIGAHGLISVAVQ